MKDPLSKESPQVSESVACPSEWVFLQPSILDGMHDSIITTDLNGVVTGCNRAATQLYGYSSSELIGRSVGVFYTEQDQHTILQTVLNDVKTRGEFRGEVRNLTRQGKLVYVHLSVALLYEPDGTPAGMVGFSVDNTAQKLGELAVRQSDEYKRELASAQEQSALPRLIVSAVEQAQDSFLITEAHPLEEPGPRILYVNRAFERMTGYPREEVLGRSPRILHGPRTDQAALDRIRVALETSRAVREELIHYRKDGTEFAAEVSIDPIPGPAGAPTHWVMVQRDVTGQRAERELRASEEQRLYSLVETIPQLLWTASNEGHCQFVTQSCARFIGVTAEECYGGGWLGFAHPDDRESTAQAWTEAVQKGQPFSTEYRLRRHDGQYVWFLHQAYPRRTEDGTILEWIGSSTDISKQKMSEEVIRKTEKLAAVGRLSSSIAHEMNNPLAAVTNLLYLLSMQPTLDKTSRDYLRTAQEELSRVSEIAAHTLRFHKQSSAPAPARISEIIDSVLAFYRPRLNQSGIELLREYRRTEQLVCYASEIRHAIVNLIGNSIEASKKGGRLRVRVRPSVSWRARQRSGIRITIADTGSGIRQDHLDQIYEPFFTTKADTATGLGLWITKDLIAKHGGTIKVRSSTRLGRSGTVFSVLLPYASDGR